MWAIVDNNEIKKIVTNPETVNIDSINYSAAIFTSWSDSDRLNIGVYPVIKGTALDARFYKSKTPTYAIDGNTVVETIVKDSDLNLSDLKTTWIKGTKDRAHELIKDFEWYVQRKVLADIAIPDSIINYAAAVRTKCKEITDDMTAASDMDAFVELFEGENPKYKDWPDDSSISSLKRYR